MKNLLIAGTAILTLSACGGAEKTLPEQIADIAQTIETDGSLNGLSETELTSIMDNASKIIDGVGKAKSASTIATGAAFLAENAQADGVITTDSGLQYKVIQPGLEGGTSPGLGQGIAAHYHGYFLDGDVFDSSYSRGQPLTGPSNGFIPGWNEALGDMKVCEARTLYINSDLAYGDNGRGGIPGGSTLLFNMQLLAIAPESEGGEPQQCPEDKVLLSPEAYK